MPSPAPVLPRWQTVARNDPVLLLIAANLFTIVLALVQGWNFVAVILVYWFQSVVIGITTVIQLLFVRIREEPPPVVTWLPDMRWNWSKELPERTWRNVMAGFFVFHYGGYHLIFLGIVWAISSVSGIAFPALWELVLPAAFFLLTHLYSACYYWPTEGLFLEQMWGIFLKPYARVIPMQAVAMLGFLIVIPFVAIPSLGIERAIANGVILVTFLVAKTYMDVRAHRKKHASPVRFRWGSGTVR
jgi:hypothetical protein